MAISLILATLALGTTAVPAPASAIPAPLDLASADQSTATEQTVPPPPPPPEKKVLPLSFGPYPPGWQIDFGPGILAVPEFPGSDGLRILPIPLLDIRYKDKFFASVQSGIGYNLVNTRKLRLGPILRPEFGRRSRDVAAFPGLRPIGFTVEAGGFVAFQPSLFTTLQLEVRKAIGGHDGTLADLSLRRIKLKGKWTIGYGGRLRLADATYFRNYYGITPAAAITTGLRPYNPRAGLNDAGVSVFVSRRLGGKWNATLFSSYSRLLDQAAASPITTSRFGSRNQVTIGSAISYRFRFQ